MPFDRLFQPDHIKSNSLTKQYDDLLNHFLFIKAKAISTHISILGLPKNPLEIPAVRNQVNIMIMTYGGRERRWPFRHNFHYEAIEGHKINLVFDGHLNPTKKGWKLKGRLTAPEQVLGCNPLESKFSTVWNKIRTKLGMPRPQKQKLYKVFFEGGITTNINITKTHV